MLVHGMSCRAEQSNHGEYRDAEGLPGKLKQGVRHNQGSLSLALASASLSALAPFSFTTDELLSDGKKHCCQHFLSSASYNFSAGDGLTFSSEMLQITRGGSGCLSLEIWSIFTPIYCSQKRGRMGLHMNMDIFSEPLGLE